MDAYQLFKKHFKVFILNLDKYVLDLSVYVLQNEPFLPTVNPNTFMTYNLMTEIARFF